MFDDNEKTLRIKREKYHTPSKYLKMSEDFKYWNIIIKLFSRAEEFVHLKITNKYIIKVLDFRMLVTEM